MTNATPSTESVGLMELAEPVGLLTNALESLRRTAESLTAQLVEPSAAQPAFWPWTQLLDSTADRHEIVERLLLSRASANEPLIEHVRSLACAQIATIGLLVELLDRQTRESDRQAAA